MIAAAHAATQISSSYLIRSSHRRLSPRHSPNPLAPRRWLLLSGLCRPGGHAAPRPAASAASTRHAAVPSAANASAPPPPTRRASPPQAMPPGPGREEESHFPFASSHLARLRWSVHDPARLRCGSACPPRTPVHVDGSSFLVLFSTQKKIEASPRASLARGSFGDGSHQLQLSEFSIPEDNSVVLL